MSSRPGFYEDDAGGKSAPGGNQQQSKQQAADKQSGKGDKDKSLPTGKGNEQSSGWFGGIWGKLSLKPKNQMILPDDKNPSVSGWLLCESSEYSFNCYSSTDCLGSG